MNGLFTFLFIGLVIYMIIHKNGGMGCCGGHHEHHANDSFHRDRATRVNPQDEWKNDVIDLKKEDYREIPIGDSYAGHKSH